VEIASPSRIDPSSTLLSRYSWRTDDLPNFPLAAASESYTSTARTLVGIEISLMSKQATIYRMVTPTRLCPWEVKEKDLLKRKDYQVTDHHLTSKEANDAYKLEHGCPETPQVYLDGKKVGGYGALRAHPGLSPDSKEGKAGS
jgi:glutaredoxin